MGQNSEIGITVEAWAEITIKEWIKKIKALGIHNPGQLVNSLYHHVNTSANGNPDYVKFVFEYYGKFVDMGVGKGVKLEDRTMLVNADKTSRKAKPWYSSVFLLQVKILTKILAEKYATQAADMVVTELDWSNKKYVPKKRATISSGKKRSKGMTVKQYDKLHGN
jgi:hypothetical protein